MERKHCYRRLSGLESFLTLNSFAARYPFSNTLFCYTSEHRPRVSSMVRAMGGRGAEYFVEEILSLETAVSILHLSHKLIDYLHTNHAVCTWKAKKEQMCVHLKQPKAIITHCSSSLYPVNSKFPCDQRRTNTKTQTQVRARK